jgi:hypothetical protein
MDFVAIGIPSQNKPPRGYLGGIASVLVSIQDWRPIPSTNTLGNPYPIRARNTYALCDPIDDALCDLRALTIPNTVELLHAQGCITLFRYILNFCKKRGRVVPVKNIY